MDWTTILAACSIPTSVSAFCLWLVERKIAKRDEKQQKEREDRQKITDDREKKREQYELCLLNSVNASIALGEATARAVQRVPDFKCNGDMHAALEFAEKAKKEQKEFMNQQAIESLQD